MPNVTITLEQNEIAAAKAEARRQFRSLSQHVAYLIERDSATRRTSAATETASRRIPPRKKAPCKCKGGKAKEGRAA